MIMKIAVLVSGGVDSAVALKLLKEEGHDLTAYYLKIWLEDELSFLGQCPWEEDLKYVRDICEKEKVKLKIINLQREYFEKVVDYTIREVKKGHTPNPDIMCNNNIKFGLFLKKIHKRYDKIATGHYARIIEEKGRFLLKKAPDKIKDQTYFLCNLKQYKLKKLVFPVGKYSKHMVRNLAKKFNLPNKDRKDSQGICFLGKLKYNDYLRHYLGEKKGDILEHETGEILGSHNGYWFYTIGQRKGIGLSGGPYFIVKKDIKKNIIYVSKKYHSADKKRDELTVTGFNWFKGAPPEKSNLQVKLRHGPESYKCKLSFPAKNKGKIKLEKSDQGIAAGQFAAFYDKDICLGSAVIVE